ncbi:Hsp20/alpha crystallin family protein [Exiguobacterium aurantiacum]|uniref:T786P28D n=1 Tax=Exiguobacterium aurantiacum TaxID=33987 RepID=A0A377FQL8_9BACL|nr:Hsp20/alpha crystallin family protein [Exiguobacterium aurantiacum]STO06998.1 T786P28D [Exiguobacterium aurantiacum]
MFDLPPFRKNELDRLRKDLFGDMFERMNQLFDPKEGATSFLDSFKLDVKDQESQYVIEAEMPGIQKENIHVRYDKDHLVLSVDQREEKEEDKDYVYRERRVTSMQRSLYLPNVKEDGIKAKLADGVLHLTIPKADDGSTTRTIEIEG